MRGKKQYAQIEEELKKSIRGLNAANKFNVVIYHASAESAFLEMEPASEAGKRKAIEFFMAKSPRFSEKGESGTGTDLALQMALKWKPETLILLSDTAKSWSTRIGGPETIRLTREEWNRGRKTKISTVCWDRIGGDTSAKDWMRDLAKQSGGECKEVEYQ